MNEVIELPARQEAQNLPVTREAVERLKVQRGLLREFVQSQLRANVDYGTIPGTDKDTLYKPGAEKLSQLFGLGIKVVLSDRLIEKDSNFAMFTYRAEAYPLRSPELIIATCEGSCNSQEKKYKERNIYEWEDQKRSDGSVYKKKVFKGKEETPITDVMNTLIKMAQKRAYVGVVILATGASDFFTQDIDDPEDAAQLGITAKQEPARASVSIPKATSAKSQDETTIPNCDCGNRLMVSRLNSNEYYCVKCKTTKPRK